ncbi:hypothetical protein LF1_00280 [Rubripirellula obstinata]|uniref:Uncharacterized protein n=1 Tax=Rubripirellula obstinata TaxID=406547 RepID=A0A5B1CBD8_9BACT|nr:hypothetical protein LF1_00280 [Rubripirellula obstinata]
MNTYSIFSLFAVTTFIAVAFSVGRILGPAPTLTVFVILYCAGPIVCRLIIALTARHIRVSTYTLLFSVLAAGLLVAYVFAGAETAFPLLVWTLVLWVPQLLVMRFLSSCRSGRLWYLYWGYTHPSKTPETHADG